MLEEAMMRMQTCNCQTLPVTHHGQLVGLITAENISEFLTIHSVIGQVRRSSLATRGL